MYDLPNRRVALLVDGADEPVPCEGSYFLFCGIDGLGFDGNDVDLCRYLATEVGVAAIPVSAFYKEGGPNRHIRFCFAKQDAVIDAAVDKLKGHFG